MFFVYTVMRTFNINSNLYICDLAVFMLLSNLTVARSFILKKRERDSLNSQLTVQKQGGAFGFMQGGKQKIERREREFLNQKYF